MRGKWTNNEKKIVLNYFKKHGPKKHECEEYVKQNREKITIIHQLPIGRESKL